MKKNCYCRDSVLSTKWHVVLVSNIQAGIYLFKVVNRIPETKCEICSKPMNIFNIFIT